MTISVLLSALAFVLMFFFGYWKGKTDTLTTTLPFHDPSDETWLELEKFKWTHKPFGYRDEEGNDDEVD